MRNKHLLLVFVAMLGLAFVYPTSLSAQKDKKKKEKKRTHLGTARTIGRSNH
ncbi:hypothetical protein NXY46_10720 [Bacteroides ovatus]|nr:hypothetical protein [Bacteroides ovatus]